MIRATVLYMTNQGESEEMAVELNVEKRKTAVYARSRGLAANKSFCVFLFLAAPTDVSTKMSNNRMLRIQDIPA